MTKYKVNHPVMLNPKSKWITNIVLLDYTDLNTCSIYTITKAESLGASPKDDRYKLSFLPRYSTCKYLFDNNDLLIPSGVIIELLND